MNNENKIAVISTDGSEPEITLAFVKTKTTCGVSAQGRGYELLIALSSIVSALHKRGFDPDIIHESVKMGLDYGGDEE